MIQETGQIKGLNPKTSEAVQKRLFEMGYHWSGSQETFPGVNEFYWYGNKKILLVGSMANDQPLHTLADFGLLPDGSPMLTMEDIEVGTSYEVRKDLEVGEKYGTVNIEELHHSILGRTVVVAQLFDDCFFAVNDNLSWRLAPQMLQCRVEDTPQFKFGDKVKVEGMDKPRWFVHQLNGVTCWLTDQIPTDAKSFNAYYYQPSRISHWPKEVFWTHNEDVDIKIDAKGIELQTTTGEIHFDFSIIDDLVEARKKVQA